MSDRQRAAHPAECLLWGRLRGLICSPCTTAPLSAILLYIAQSGNMWLGGGTLYLYALGMGLPLMLITVFGNRLLPKSGPVDGTSQNRVWFCDPRTAGLPAGASDW
ncbi:cytochrome c biogenesis protein CcdA [Escherichia coli]